MHILTDAKKTNRLWHISFNLKKKKKEAVKERCAVHLIDHTELKT